MIAGCACQGYRKADVSPLPTGNSDIVGKTAVDNMLLATDAVHYELIRASKSPHGFTAIVNRTSSTWPT